MQQNDVHVQRACKELSKSTVTIPTIEYIHLIGCQKQVSQFMKLELTNDEQDAPIMLQSEVIGT